MKDFLLACRRIINTAAANGLVSTDLLLWIYLNLLFYPYLKEKSEEDYKESFLKVINGDRYFQGLCQLSATIPNCVYEALREEILLKYTSRAYDAENKQYISLKSLESIYENQLQEEQRTKTGTYYTPEYIVAYIAQCTLESYLFKETGTPISLGGGDIEALQLDKERVIEVSAAIDKLKLIDIACGGGVFIRGSLGLLFSLKKKLYNLMDITVTDYSIKKTIIENNLYGIDIQEPTVVLCRILLLMELPVEVYSRNPMSLKMNISQGNALDVEDEEVDSRYDIVIGNPPYLGERGNKEFFMELKRTSFGNKYYESKMDYFYYFIYRAAELLKEGGCLGYITTNYFVTADGASKLRGFIKTNLSFKAIVNFNDVGVFQDAKGQHNMIFITTKGTRDNVDGKILSFQEGKYSAADIEEVLLGNKLPSGVKLTAFTKQESLYDESSNILINNEGPHSYIIKKIIANTYTDLASLCNINQGIVSGADRLTAKLREKINTEIEIVGEGIFVLKKEEAIEKGLFNPHYKKYLKPFYKNSHVKKYRAEAVTELYILYITDENLKNIEEYPLILKHLLPFKSILEERREVKRGVISWYSLQWPRNNIIFQGEKIIVPQRSLSNIFGYNNDEWFASADVYFISSKNNMISLKYILGLLNSSLIYFWLYYRGKRKGDYLELYATPLKSIPTATLNTDDIVRIETLVDVVLKRIEANIDYADIQKEIDGIVYNIYGLNNYEQQEINEFVSKRRKT